MTMAFCYDKLWKLLIDKHMNRVELRDAVGITPATLAKMGKNQNVSMEVLGKICQILDCNIGDIMDYIHEVQEEK
jgi:DNA-binding Xre family transcriptional regulator